MKNRASSLKHFERIVRRKYAKTNGKIFKKTVISAKLVSDFI